MIAAVRSIDEETVLANVRRLVFSSLPEPVGKCTYLVPEVGNDGDD